MIFYYDPEDGIRRTNKKLNFVRNLTYNASLFSFDVLRLLFFQSFFLSFPRQKGKGGERVRRNTERNEIIDRARAGK